MPKSLGQQIPQEIASNVASEKSPFDPRVAISDKLKYFGEEKIVFTFEAYNNNQCEIAKLEKTEAKKLTNTLKKASTIAAKSFRQGNISGITCKAVSDTGKYTDLFTQLPSDIELLEFYYSDAGRVFGYIVQNIFSIVTILKKHR